MTGSEMDAMLTPDVVWDIVTRWVAMQLLSKIYMSRLVKERFVEGTGNGPWVAMLPEGMGDFEANHEEDQPAYPGDIGLVDCLPLRKDLLTCGVRGRFHRAVTAIWIMQEACQLLKMTKWEAKIQLHQAELDLRKFSICTTAHSIQEDVDALEVLDFLHIWCVPRIFARYSKLRECVVGEDMFVDAITQNNLDVYWDDHIGIMNQILRPSDVLELLVMSTNGLQRLCPDQGYIEDPWSF
jgi:hypothetical protein